MRAAALALLWAGCALAQTVETISSEKLAMPATRSASHDLHIAAHMFEGTRWDISQARTALSAAGGLFAQCGIAVSIDLQVLRAPRRFRYLFTPDSRELLRNLAPRKPALFLVDDTRNQPAYDAEAIGRGNARTRPEMADSAWITFTTRDLPVVIAHEITHVLSDSGAHSTEIGNLMNEDTDPGNTRLTPAQCETLRARGEANALLAPRVVKP
jgi:hypothetical protein